jgi:hypothetical protein
MTVIQKSDSEIIREINDKLSHLIGLLGIQGKERADQVAFLVGLNFTNAEISRITGIPKGTVDRIRAGRKAKTKESV